MKKRTFWLFVVLSLLLLTAYGGDSQKDVAQGSQSFFSMMSAEASTMSTSTGTPVTADMTMDWAEQEFSDLFPSEARTKLSVIEYEGVIYNARAYVGAWGTRYLGITHDGRIFGLGDFTDHTLQQFETIGYWADQVLADLNSSGDTGDGTGKIITNIGRGSGIRSIALQSDGKIVAAGVSRVEPTGRADFTITRYNTDGSLDTSFSDDGIVITNIGKRLASTDWVRDVAIQPDGKIVVAGYSVTQGTDQYGIALVRYNADGSLDSSFSEDGIVTTFGGSEKNFFGHSVMIQDDGKILIAGSTNVTNRYQPGYSTLLIRYNVDGSLDTSFAINGIQNDSSTRGVADAAIQLDGKILIIGTVGPDFSELSVLARYNSNGSLDTSFGNNGIVRTEIGSDPGSWNTASAIAFSPDGKIVVVGPVSLAYGGIDFSVARYHPDGSLDLSFAGKGYAITDFFGETDMPWSVTVQSDGKILVAGETTYVRDDPYPFPGVYRQANIDFALTRYNLDGSLDNSFADDGKLNTDFRKLTDIAYSVTVQPDGRIIVGGSSFLHVPEDTHNGGHNDFAIARYIEDGSLDTEFKSD